MTYKLRFFAKDLTVQLKVGGVWRVEKSWKFISLWKLEPYHTYWFRICNTTAEGPGVHLMRVA